MNRFKDFDQFNEASEFNWKDYGEKRELVETVIPRLVNRIRPLKEFGQRIFHKIAYDEVGGTFNRERQMKFGFNADMMHEIYNQFNTIGSSVGPNLAGEFRMVKKTIWNKIFGTKSLAVTRGTSIIDHLIALLPEFREELKKKESDLQIQDMVDQIWAVHPNNPKNKEWFEEHKVFSDMLKKAEGRENEEEKENTETREDIEKETKQLTDAVKKISPFKKLEENRKDMYDEEEWYNDYTKQTVIGRTPNEQYFIQKAKNYKQLAINLSRMVLKYKQEIIDTLAPYMSYIDKKVYDSLLLKIDSLYNYINGDSSKIKGVKTRLQYSIVEMLDKYINKDNTNYKTFF